MVKRKPQTNKPKSAQNEQADEGLSAAEIIIDADREADSKAAGKFSRTELISAFAALLSLVAVGLALWPVLTTKMANERQAELSARVDALSSALESLAAAQTELAKTVVEQQGLSGALKTDLEKLTAQATEQAETLAVNLRAELESLAQKLQKTQQNLMESLNPPTLPAENTEQTDNSANIKDDAANISANRNQADEELANQPGNQQANQKISQPSGQQSATDETWLPKWADVPLDNMAKWFSDLVTIRKTEDTPEEAPRGPQSSSESTSQ